MGRDHVAPGCVVGAYETGTLVYFRDRSVNLDGKVDHDALEARDGRPLARSTWTRAAST